MVNEEEVYHINYLNDSGTRWDNARELEALGCENVKEFEGGVYGTITEDKLIPVFETIYQSARFSPTFPDKIEYFKPILRYFPMDNQQFADFCLTATSSSIILEEQPILITATLNDNTPNLLEAISNEGKVRASNITSTSDTDKVVSVVIITTHYKKSEVEELQTRLREVESSVSVKRMHVFFTDFTDDSDFEIVKDLLNNQGVIPYATYDSSGKRIVDTEEMLPLSECVDCYNRIKLSIAVNGDELSGIVKKPYPKINIGLGGDN